MATCQLTERVIFQQFNGTQTNSNGFAEEQWKDYYSCWAKKESLSGKEYLKAHATQSQVLVGFTVRVCRKIIEILEHYDSKTFRIIHKGQIYDIKYGHDVNNQHSFADFKCEWVGPCQP